MSDPSETPVVAPRPTPVATPALPGVVWRYGPFALLAGALFWLLVEGLGYGPQTAIQLENNAIAMSLVAQQSARLARISEAFSRMHNPDATNSVRSAGVRELRESAPQFTDTLQRLRNGGTVESLMSPNSFTLHALESASAQQILQGLDSTWRPLGELIDGLGDSSETPSWLSIEGVSEKFQARLPELQRGLRELAGDLGSQAQAQAHWLRAIQTSALVLSGGLGAVLWYLCYRRIFRAETQTATAELLTQQTRTQMDASLAKTERLLQENSLLLATVQQGLLVIDSKHRIGSAYSKECEALFRQDNLPGTSLIKVLQPYFPEKLLQTVRDYLDLLFNPAKKEKALVRINPLKEVEVNLPQLNGTAEVRHWEFNFRRVPEGGKVAKVFVSVNDVTESVRMRQELQAAERLKERQFEILASVLQVDPVQFGEFLDQTDQEIQRVSGSLSDATGQLPPIALRERLDALFRAAHSIKGHAAFIGANSFVATVHEFEDQIQKLRARPNLHPSDLVPAIRQYTALTRDLALARNVVTRLGTFRKQASSTSREIAPGAGQSRPEDSAFASIADNGSDSGGLVATLNQLLQKLAGQLGKQVRLDASGFDDTMLADRQALVREIVVQLGRNSLAHGLESPAERRSAGKPPTASVTLSLHPDDETSPGGLALVFRVDGRGLDPEKIRARPKGSGSCRPKNSPHSTIVRRCS